MASSTRRKPRQNARPLKKTRDSQPRPAKRRKTPKQDARLATQGELQASRCKTGDKVQDGDTRKTGDTRCATSDMMQDQ